jgi:4-amino-4-deoxy-L-arabinose transferase-like glycosyltransferase
MFHSYDSPYVMNRIKHCQARRNRIARVGRRSLKSYNGCSKRQAFRLQASLTQFKDITDHVNSDDQPCGEELPLMNENVKKFTKAMSAYGGFILFALIVSGFVFVASQQLEAVPVPDTDEAMTLQVPYEMINRGKLAFPMYRFLGGNIENVWHSYTPVFFLAAGGFMKIFGWGLVQGRVFNLITTTILLLMVYLIGRRLSNWQSGLIAVVLIISDPVFFARSRLARNDMLAASFGLLAFYLYEKAQEDERKTLYVAAGIAAGAGVMCHTNLVYILAVIFALMLLKHGLRIVKSSGLYLFAASAFAVMAYEIIYDLIDYQNFVLQNRKDTIHFRILEPLGWLRNIIDEPARYVEWFNTHGVKFAPDATLLHIFLTLAVLAVLYLAGRSVIHLKRKDLANEPRVRLLIATVIVVMFFAIITQRKILQYVVHISPWLALCVAIMLADLFTFLKSLRLWQGAMRANLIAVTVAMLLITVYGYVLIKQYQGYLRQVNNGTLADFGEIKAALRSVVPEGVCPVSIGSGFLWLAFTEYDECYFAHMETRLDAMLDIDGKDYALIVRPKFMNKTKKLTGGVEKYHLIGELKKTVYGTFYIYYTGTDPRYLALKPKRFRFFGQQRGCESDELISTTTRE